MADGMSNDPLFNVRNYITACEAGELEIEGGIIKALTKLEKAVLLAQVDKTDYTNLLVERVVREVDQTVVDSIMENGNE